mgnify:CR=1 FL=1
MEDKHRLDKFLWCVRLFKHRTQAAKACQMGQILLNNREAKSSANVRIGDILSVKSFIIFRSYKVIELLENRVGAPLVNNYIEEITSADDLFKLKTYFEMQKYTPKYDKPGRPTKKDRRKLDDYLGD